MWLAVEGGILFTSTGQPQNAVLFQHHSGLVFVAGFRRFVDTISLFVRIGYLGVGVFVFRRFGAEAIDEFVDAVIAICFEVEDRKMLDKGIARHVSHRRVLRATPIRDHEVVNWYPIRPHTAFELVPICATERGPKKTKLKGRVIHPRCHFWHLVTYIAVAKQLC